MKRIPMAGAAVLLCAVLSGCVYTATGEVITGQPLPSGSQPVDACAPAHLAAMRGKSLTGAIAANPGLSGMSAGLDRAGLNSLDEVPALTFFATSDDFLAIFPLQRISALWDNPEQLAGMLTDYAVPQRLEPQRLIGAHTAMGGARITVTTDSGGLHVNDTTVRCQQLDTTNAAVYIVDKLLSQ